MAIALEETVDGGLGDGGGDSFTLTSWTPGSNELVLVSVAMRSISITPTVSGNSLTFVAIANIANTQNQGSIHLFRALGSPSTGQITVTVTGNTTPVSAQASRFSGVDTSGTHGSGAVEATATDAGPAVNNDDVKISVTTVTADAWAFATSWQRADTLSDPPDTGETMIFQSDIYGTAGDRTRCSAWYEAVASPASTQLGTDNNLSGENDWAVIAVSIKPAGAAAGQPMSLRGTAVPGLRAWQPGAFR